MFIPKCLLTFFVLAVAFHGSKACSCVPMTEIPVEPDCPGRFLSVVTITGVKHTVMHNHYKFDVIADYTPKLAEKASMKDSESISSADNGAACGVTLKIGQTYLLFGSRNAKTAGVFMCGSVYRALEKIPSEAEAKQLMDEIYNQRCVKH